MGSASNVLRLLGALAVLTWSGLIGAQTPFPSPILLDATSHQQVATQLGAMQAERSGHLLIDAPDVVLPGAYPVKIRSEIPGTTHMVLLRISLLDPGTAPPIPPEKVVVYAKGLQPGQRAADRVDVQADHHRQILVLYVMAQGRWFSAGTEVKLARPADR